MFLLKMEIQSRLKDVKQYRICQNKIYNTRLIYHLLLLKSKSIIQSSFQINFSERKIKSSFCLFSQKFTVIVEISEVSSYGTLHIP